MTRAGFPYFYMELPSGEKLFGTMRRGAHFPLQFGRELLASPPFLNKENRVDWRQCEDSVEDETNWTQAFRDEFKSFDFTLE